MYFLNIDEPLEIVFKDGVYQTTIDKINFRAASEKQLLEIVSQRYQIADHDAIEQKHKNYVFHPKKFKPEIKYL